MRLTALLMLADYLEDPGPGDPNLANLIRGLRFPHWQEWSHLADGLARFWITEQNRPRCHFHRLAAGWASVSRLKANSKGQEPPIDPIWNGLLEGFGGVGGRSRARSANDAIWELRNRTAHREGTVTADSEKEQDAEFDRLLPLAETVVSVLFGKAPLDLLRSFPSAVSDELPFELVRASRDKNNVLKVISLHGPHPDLTFETRDADESWEDALAQSPVSVTVAGVAIPVYPLAIPTQDDEDGPPLGMLDPVAMVDGVSEAKLTVLGVQRAATVKGHHLDAALAALRKKHTDLLLGREDTKPWTVVSWASMTTAQTLDELAGRKYFPEFYVERPDMDSVFGRYAPQDGKALMLLGEAGAGKSSLMARFVDGRTASADQSDALGRIAEEAEERQDLIAYLAGRSDYSTSRADVSGAQILADAVAHKLGIRDGAFNSLADLVMHLALNKDDQIKDREFWILLDGLNEADRFVDLVHALDVFLPELAKAPRTRLVISMRSGAFYALSSRDAQLGAHGGEVFSNSSHFLSFPDAQDKLHPWLELRRFRAAEAAEAYERRQRARPERAAGIDHGRLSPALKSLLQSPLYLHLFHETWAGQREVPGDLDEGGLLDAYLRRLAGEVSTDTDRRIAGVAEWLDRLGTLMLERRAPMLPMSIADQWADEWRKSVGFKSLDVVTKLDPIEELAAASVLLRPAEAGFGVDRERIGYQFTHQKLAERVLLRALDRRISPRTLPTREELSDWTAHAASDPPFAELSGALAEWVRRLTIAGEGEALTCVLDIEDNSTRKTLMTSLILATAIAPEKDAEAVLDRLASEAITHEEGYARFVATAWDTAVRLEETAPRAAARRVFSFLLAVSEQLATADPGNADFQEGVSDCCHQLGGLAHEAGDTAAARAWSERGLEIREALADADPNDVRAKYVVSTSYTRLGNLAREAGDTATAGEWFERGLKIDEQLAVADPSNVDFQDGLAVSYNNLGELAWVMGDTAAARAWFERGLEIVEQLAAADQSEVAFQKHLVYSCIGLGVLAKAAGDTANARAFFERALKIDETLAAADPSNIESQQSLSMSCDRLGELAQAAGDMAAARAWFERGLKISETLAAADPSNIKFQYSLAASCEQLGGLAQAAGDTAGTRAWFERVLKVSETLAAADPSNVELQYRLSFSCDRIGGLAKAAGDTATAREWFERGLKIDEQFAAADPSNVKFQQSLSVSCERLGDLAKAAGDTACARAWFERELKIDEQLVAAGPSNVALQCGLSDSCVRLGELAQAAGDTAAARAWFERVLKMFEALATAEPGNVNFKNNVSAACQRLGDLAEAAGDQTSARAWFERGLKISETLAAADPSNIIFQHNVSVSCNGLGRLAQAAGDTAAARAWFERAG
jgi:tetratricopeptide (TPR) repeat protein